MLLLALSATLLRCSLTSLRPYKLYSFLEHT